LTSSSSCIGITTPSRGTASSGDSRLFGGARRPSREPSAELFARTRKAREAVFTIKKSASFSENARSPALQVAKEGEALIARTPDGLNLPVRAPSFTFSPHYRVLAEILGHKYRSRHKETHMGVGLMMPRYIDTFNPEAGPATVDLHLAQSVMTLKVAG
jgi:hypothetical protein